MNIFLREMKAHRFGLGFWSLGMVAMVYMGMAKYGAYEASGENVQVIMDALPRAVRAVFGLTGFDLSTAAGFYGVLFNFVAIIAALHAVLLGSDLVAKEERDRTSEFLFARPASRARILTGKLLAGVVNLVVLNIVTLVSSLAVIDVYNKEEPFTGDVVALMVGLFFIQLINLSIGALVAGAIHRPKAAGSRASTIMFATFLLSVAVTINERLDVLAYLTPFLYFDAADVMGSHGLDAVFVVLSVAITGVAVALTYRLLAARDLVI